MDPEFSINDLDDDSDISQRRRQKPGKIFEVDTDVDALVCWR